MADTSPAESDDEWATDSESSLWMLSEASPEQAVMDRHRRQTSADERYGFARLDSRLGSPGTSPRRPRPHSTGAAAVCAGSGVGGAAACGGAGSGAVGAAGGAGGGSSPGGMVHARSSSSPIHMKMPMLSSNTTTSGAGAGVSAGGGASGTGDSGAVAEGGEGTGRARVVADLGIRPWLAQPHVSLLHRQGLHSPTLSMKALYPMQDRPYYQMYLPIVSKDQREKVLCCRKKQKQLKFRISLDPDNLAKRNNPAYVGKISCRKDDMSELGISLDNGLDVARIQFSRVSGRTFVHVTIVNQFLNSFETGPKGLVLSSPIQSYVQPIMCLKVESSKRPVLVMYKENSVGARARARTSTGDDIEKFLMDFDYPLTVYLTFCICCAVNYYRLWRRKHGDPV